MVKLPCEREAVNGENFDQMKNRRYVKQVIGSIIKEMFKGTEHFLVRDHGV